MLFYEVFETLETEHSLTELFQEVEITKVTASKKSNNIVIHVQSSHLLDYKSIRKMEYQLNKQIFMSNKNEARLKESYMLSQQYNAENIWKSYNTNIYNELVDDSAMNYNILRSADISFEHDIMNISLEESFLIQRKSIELKAYIEMLYAERFSYHVTVNFEFFKPMKNEQNKENRFVNHDIYNPQGDENKQVQHLDNDVSVNFNTITNNTDNTYNANGVNNNLNNSGNINKNESNYGASHSNRQTDVKAESDNNRVSIDRADKIEIKKVETKKAEAEPGRFQKFSSYDKIKNNMKKKVADDPDVIYGRSFDGEAINICEVLDEIGEVVIRGKIISYDDRELKNEKHLIIFGLTDFTDTINVKMFVRNEQMVDIKDTIKKGAFIKVNGLAVLDRYDKEISISSVVGIKTIPDFTTKRIDKSKQKRVELHAHTMMSDMDAVVSASDLVKTAFEWGMKGIAITDHGCVQAFPEASHAIEPYKYKNDPEKMKRAEEFKVIYGMEAYLVDDCQDVVVNDKGQGLDDICVVFDIETTGFGPVSDKIIEIGAVKLSGGKIIDNFSTFINPQVPIPFEIEKLTGIKDEMVLNSPVIEEVLPKFLSFCESAVMVAHNASFDISFIKKKAELMGIVTDFTVVDTVGLSRALLQKLSKYKLDSVAKALNIPLLSHHRAVDDAGCTALIYQKLMKMLKDKNINYLAEINKFAVSTPEIIKKIASHHAILLCKNNTGRVNLYRMLSRSNIDYFRRRPRIPKSMLINYREGLIIGSACEAGELYQAILNERSKEDVHKLADFYDYYEIQPLGNNRFMIDSPKFSVQSEEDLIEINKKIVALGEEYQKPVIATCDVHFLNPEDEVYRRIIMASKGFEDADKQAPLYFRTTEEMLDEFMYLGKKKAEEVVIKNTNLIADSIEKISPVRPDKCPPVIPDSDQTLRKICYDKAHAMYGTTLPKQVKDRLEHELLSIINNGFAVMYIIAQKLVWKSNEDGYLVGSRGSVGSSFAATMSGITEVNPLPAHYYCTNCFYSDFDSDLVKSYAASSGCDMPDRECPSCGNVLSKDGHNIPFETFLGFYGDKEPDIDLNFSGEYQSKAHDYTEIIFGKGHTFRAGTIGTMAEKTAYGLVMKYNEERGIHKRTAEINRLADGCVGVRRTTGQHPGGIIVLPYGEEIYTFTPVQRPANDMNTKVITTHFDYHSIDHNLLKLDILGHDDPTMIRMLEDLTGVDAKKIRMDDPDILSLFESTKALGIKPSDIDGCDLGSLGLPELGTDFVMQMLRDTKPKSFSDMIRISGLSHGTDVWLNNTSLLIAEEKCTLSTAICTRDDIMTYLISMGVENGMAFKIMESVRKGKGLTPEMEEAMVGSNIPDWYIWSCKQIKYMFPKAHACAYIMMAFRIAYFKIHYPLAYYAAFFSIRASAFNYEMMCQGRERLEYHMAELKKRAASNDPLQKLTKKDEDTVKDMKIVQEMYARGFDFKPIDIYTAKVQAFQIVDGKIMPSLSSIDGLGEKAADQVIEAVEDGPFLSRDDFRTRCKVSTTVVDKMGELGLLYDLPLTNQISLMDLLEA